METSGLLKSKISTWVDMVMKVTAVTTVMMVMMEMAMMTILIMTVVKVGQFTNMSIPLQGNIESHVLTGSHLTRGPKNLSRV